MIEAIDHVEILARDIEETESFYVDVLGFTPWRHTTVALPDGENWELSCLRLGEMMLEILQANEKVVELPAEQSRVGMRMLALRVDNMKKTLKELKKKGVEVCLAPSKQKVYDGLRAEIKDPNGIAIELREWQNGDSIKNEAWRPRSKDVTLLAKSSPGETSTD